MGIKIQKLFPIEPSSYQDIRNIFDIYVKLPNTRTGVFAIGTAHIWKFHHNMWGCEVLWDSLITIPEKYSKKITCRFLPEPVHLLEADKEILIKIGIKFPLIDKEYLNSFNINELGLRQYSRPVIYGLSSSTPPEKMGWWSSDFSGYGSLIIKPFEIQISNEFIAENIRQIGYTALDVLSAYEKGWQKFSKETNKWQERWLKNVILPFMSGYDYHVCDSPYTGEPGKERSLKNFRVVNPKEIEDLKDLANLGTYVSKITRSK